MILLFHMSFFATMKVFNAIFGLRPSLGFIMNFFSYILVSSSSFYDESLCILYLEVFLFVSLLYKLLFTSSINDTIRNRVANSHKNVF